jgi:hypothetical protein
MSMFGLHQEVRLRQMCAYRCSVCHQLWDEDNAMNTTFLVKLFGAKNYYVQCCCCGQGVEDDENPAYRRRWQKWAHKLVRARLAELRKLMASRHRPA